jgi:hypothetical protein
LLACLLIDRRDRIIAVISMDETKVNSEGKRVTIADRFEEAREFFRREGYRLPSLRRRSRRNDFVKLLTSRPVLRSL